jgi:hypothetical protein
MASADQRITMEYPVEVTTQPTTDGTVKGTPGKVDPAEVRRMRALARADRGEDQ